MKQQLKLVYDDNELDIIDKFKAALESFGIVIEDDGEEHDGFMLINVSVSPEAQKAFTQVFDDGQQNWDRGAGWPPPDDIVKDSEGIVSAYNFVKRFTEYADKPMEDDE